MTTTLALDTGSLVAIITAIVGLVALWLPADAGYRTPVLRSLSAALGLALAVATLLVAPGVHSAQDILQAAEAGLALGTGTTVAVAAVKRVPVPRVSVGKRQQAAAPVEVAAPAA